MDLDTILIEYENYYYLRYQKKPKISKSLETSKTDTIKNRTKVVKKTTCSQNSQDFQSLDQSFMTVTSMNNLGNATLEHEYSLPSLDLSHWKDEWQVYAEMISKVITKMKKIMLYYKKNELVISI